MADFDDPAPKLMTVVFRSVSRSMWAVMYNITSKSLVGFTRFARFANRFGHSPVGEDLRLMGCEDPRKGLGLPSSISGQST